MNRKIITVIITFLSISIFLTGCGNSPQPPKKTNITEENNGIYQINMYIGDLPSKIRLLAKKNKQYFFQEAKVHLFQKALEKAIDITERERKQNFALVQPNANTLKGFPLNNYKDLNKFCLYLNRCNFKYKDGYFTLNILPLDNNVSYKIAAININSLKNEFNNMVRGL